MIHSLALVPVALLVGLPLLASPSWLVGAVGTVAGLLCAGGALGRSIPLLAVGGAVALCEYALALWAAGGPPDVLGAIVFGLALVLLLDVAHFLHRFRGATLDSSVVRRQVRHWLATALGGGVAAAALMAVADVLSLTLPRSEAPVVAAAGALAGFIGVVGALRRRSRSA